MLGTASPGYLITAALPSAADTAIPRGLARADALADVGRALESLTEITRVYEAGVNELEGK